VTSQVAASTPPGEPVGEAADKGSLCFQSLKEPPPALLLPRCGAWFVAGLQCTVPG
jgi:hypothetical protein